MHSSQKNLRSPGAKPRGITFSSDITSSFAKTGTGFPQLRDSQTHHNSTLSTTIDPLGDIHSPQRPFSAQKSSFMAKDSLQNMRRSLLSDSKESKKNLNRIQLDPAAGEIVHEDVTKEDQMAELAKLNNKDYQEYKKNFHRLVFDSEKNLLYIKPSTIKVGKPEVVGDEEMTTERLLISLEGKYKSLNPEKVVSQLLKEQMKPQKPQYHIKGKRHVEEVKNQAKNVLDSQIKAMKYEKIVNETKVQIDKMSLASIEALEKVSLENEALKGELNLLRGKVEDLEAENGILLRKTQLLDKQIMEMRDAEQTVKRNYQNLESLKPIYLSLKEHFPNDDIHSILAKYQKLEDNLLAYNDRIQELEVEKINMGDEKKAVLGEVRHKDLLLKEEEMKRNKLVDIYRNELESRSLELSQAEYFKDNYLKLNKKVMELYLEWSQEIEVFNGKNKLGLKPELKDPIEILNIMSKMIKISTSKDLQNYLKRIIVSANLLLRRYFPENVNDRFDPDKIYEKIHKYIDNLHHKLEKQKAEAHKK